jgi:hypothetical protein
MNRRKPCLALLAVWLLAALSGCEGLAVAYSRDVYGQTLTGFIAADGTYGILAKKSTGKRPVKVSRQK